MTNEFPLQVVTPDKQFYNDSVEMVVAKTTEGSRGILKNRRPFVSGIVEGILKIKKDGQIKEAKISGGFITVETDKTVILTESAEWL